MNDEGLDPRLETHLGRAYEAGADEAVLFVLACGFRAAAEGLTAAEWTREVAENAGLARCMLLVARPASVALKAAGEWPMLWGGRARTFDPQRLAAGGYSMTDDLVLVRALKAAAAGEKEGRAVRNWERGWASDIRLEEALPYAARFLVKAGVWPWHPSAGGEA
jgi:hypothetical protein